jgi:hypothetical protein
MMLMSTQTLDRNNETNQRVVVKPNNDPILERALE